MASIEVICQKCRSQKVVKFGTNGEGKQRYQCQNEECEKNTFILDYTSKGHQSEIKQKIVEMALNGSGVRDTSRVLGIRINTVLSELKKKKRQSKM